jgi:hypothetical protein
MKKRLDSTWCPRRPDFAAQGWTLLFFLGALALPHCGSSSHETVRSQSQALGGFVAGTYTIVNSQSFAVDGGFYYWNGNTTEEVWTLNNGPDQQWQFTASGSGFTICNVGVPNACLSDGGGTLDIGVGQDVWTVTTSGSGYTIQSQNTGRFVTNPASPADEAVVPTSSAASAWTLNAVGGGGGGGSSLQAGNYYVEDPSSFAIDGGFYYWSGLTVEELYSLNDGPDQQWQFAVSGSGFTICNVGVPNACLSDGGSTLAIGVGVDVWTVASSGSGYTLQDQATGRFIADATAPGDAVPVPLTSSPSTWTLAAVSASPPPSGLQPYGNIPPPAGQSWHLTFDDEFDQDSPGTPNSSLWNGGTGGLPSGFCSGAESVGYTGDDCNSYFGTYPNAAYEQVISGLGLAVQGLHAAPGDNNYDDNELAGLNSDGKFIQEYGYFEWSAKLPTDHNGEGDGWHTDLWCTSPDRQVNYGPEIDLNEKVYSTGNQTYTWFTVFDSESATASPAISKQYGASGGPDLSAAFHTYAFAWRNDGSGTYGSIQGYVDGQPIANAVPISDPYWAAGMWCWAGWMQQTPSPGAWGGGTNVDSTTSNNNPLYIEHFRVWQAE